MRAMDDPPETSGELQRRGPTAQARRGWVVEFADRREARLAADSELLTEATFEGFQGRAWDRMAERLVAYGLVVIKAWLRRGVIFDRCAKKGLWIRNAQPGGIADRDDVDALADETVMLAVVGYRDNVLIPGKWDPRKGANLTTYFIGQCLFQFPNVYKRWWRETKQQEIALDPDIIEGLGLTNTPGRSATEAITRDRIRKGLEHTDDTDREILGWYAEGYTYEEIAELIGVPVGTIKSRIHRLRRRANAHDAA